MGKVKFGLSNVEYGRVNEENKVEKTEKMPGVKTAKISITNELLTVMADDGPYVVLSGGITDTTLELSVLDLVSKARVDFFGITLEKGVEKYNKNLTPNDIAILFRTNMEDGKKVWFGLLKGKFNIPGFDGTTKEGTPAPTTDTTTGQFVARGDNEDGDILYIGREDNADFDLEEFKAMVFPPVTP
ncbi:major tail protein [Carnobacterium maltaromaticum]|uniref:major tail protein n=1 Tax=Carnobacterium maltaromaticum TaxID=2751 RepID=UPI0012FC4507|nr:major tail protein [Carnobacterium maltaromaticum]